MAGLGHQHLIDLECMDGNGCGQTSYQTAEGAEYGHSHAWARGADGTISILADGGHYERSPMYHCLVLEDLLAC